MIVNHNFKVDLVRSGILPRFEAVQSDALSRMLTVQFFEAGRPWTVPKGAQVLIQYHKNDRTGGIYDTLPDESPAWSAKGNTLQVILAPQVLTAPGEATLAVTLVQGAAQLTTFTVGIDVKPKARFTGTSENYSYVTAFLPQPENSAQVGQLLRVSRVDSRGNVLATEAVSGGSGGFSAESSQTLLSLLKKAVYTENVTSVLAAFEELLSTTSPTLTAITATYTGGPVDAGTAVERLHGITVVAAYSDGTTAVVSDYSLQGTIAEGVNTVTVRYNGMTATFTVTGVAQSGGETDDLTVYTVTNHLTNATNSNTAATVEAGSAYSCTIQAADGYILQSVHITMGGTEMVNKAFTAAPLESGWSVGAVTGDIVITATAEEMPVTLSGIFASYAGGDVPVGTAVTDLTGITVTAAYSDGSTAAVTNYTLSGTIGEGSNTITVSYGGKTATFTVTGVADSSVDTGTAIFYWDLTRSLTEYVAGITAITTATQDANGLSFDKGGEYCDFGAVYGVDRTFEMDIASSSRRVSTGAENYGRLLMFDTDTDTASGGSGLIYSFAKHGWQFYSYNTGGWNGAISDALTGTADDVYARGFFNGKTLKMYIAENRHATIYVKEQGADDSSYAKLGSTVYAFPEYINGHAYIGGTVGDQIYDTVITGFRVYEGDK